MAGYVVTSVLAEIQKLNPMSNFEVFDATDSQLKHLWRTETHIACSVRVLSQALSELNSLSQFETLEL